MATVASRHQILLLCGRRLNPVISCINQKRSKTFDVVNQDYDNLAAFRRGTGGRSSFSGIVATVFGATGLLGRAVVNRLGAIGSQVIIPYRGDGYRYRDLKLAGDLGQIQFVETDIRDIESVRKALKYSNIVINCAGRFNETRNFSHDYVNAEFPVILADECVKMGIDRLIHVSHLAASVDAPGIIVKQGSRFLRTKQKGENGVMKKCRYATVFRPSMLIHPREGLLRHYEHYGRRIRRIISLWRCGLDTQIAPVHVSDVASGIINAINDPSSKGKVYEAYGPRLYTLNGICNFISLSKLDRIYPTFFRINDLIPSPLDGVLRKVLGYRDGGEISDLRFRPLIFAVAKFNDYTSKMTRLNTQRLETEHHSDIILGGPSLEDLGVELTPLEYIAHNYFRFEKPCIWNDDPLRRDLMEPGPPIIAHLNKRPIDLGYDDPSHMMLHKVDRELIV